MSILCFYTAFTLLLHGHLIWLLFSWLVLKEKVPGEETKNWREWQGDKESNSRPSSFWSQDCSSCEGEESLVNDGQGIHSLTCVLVVSSSSHFLSIPCLFNSKCLLLLRMFLLPHHLFRSTNLMGVNENNGKDVKRIKKRPQKQRENHKRKSNTWLHSLKQHNNNWKCLWSKLWVG